jgi:hypothetical protein
MVGDKHENGAGHRQNHAVQAGAIDARQTDRPEEQTSNHSPDGSQQNIKQDSLPAPGCNRVRNDACD